MGLLDKAAELLVGRTVADEIVEQLAAAGVKRIYGIVGDSLNPITDAIHRDGRIRWIHVRHEEAAAFAASAEAQLSGELTVCAGSCGPGGLHLINGLYDAHRAKAPVLAIVSHIPSTEIGTGYFQETHPQQLFQECSHYCELISTAAQMPRTLQIAMQNAIAKGGVGVIVLPGDIAAEKMPKESRALAHGVVRKFPTVRPARESVEQLARMINEAEKVTILGGAGCAAAHDQVVALAETLKAPIGYAYRGKQFLEYDNPHAVGMSGLLGYGACYEAMMKCELLLMLGTDFPYPDFYPTDAKIAQIDVRAEHLGRRCKLDLGLIGDVGEALRELSPLLKEKIGRAFLDEILAENKTRMENLDIYVEHAGEADPVHPEYVAATLNKLLADDAIVTADTGMCNVWAARYVRAKRDRRLLCSYQHGSMANALPFAVGAQLLYPERQVVSMSGDGGFAMLMGEMLTIRQLKLPVKTVIFNNSSLAFVKVEMEVAGYKEFQTGLDNPNFAAVAEAMGMRGTRVEKPADVEKALREALAHDGPAFVDVVTDPDALSMPPRIDVGQVAGYALTMGKLVLSGDAEAVAKRIKINVRHGKEVIDEVI